MSGYDEAKRKAGDLVDAVLSPLEPTESKRVKYYAVGPSGYNRFPIILVEYQRGHFSQRTETPTGESFKHYRKALERTGELNIQLAKEMGLYGRTA